jgi:hypothetical protein
MVKIPLLKFSFKITKLEQVNRSLSKITTFVSFQQILMFHTILESGDKTNDIGDEFKTIRSSQIIT